MTSFSHTAYEKRGWTHEACWDCWWEQNPYRYELGVIYAKWPVVLKQKEVLKCCFCGQPNRSAIYVRHDPADKDMACAALDREVPPVAKEE